MINKRFSDIFPSFDSGLSGASGNLTGDTKAFHFVLNFSRAVDL